MRRIYTRRREKSATGSRAKRCELVEDFEAEFFDDGIREDVFRDAFHLALRFGAAQAIELQNEELSLANTLDLRMAEGR